jgi:regulator of protease activity HflC (stomatin/prohibitin superfamily)
VKSKVSVSTSDGKKVTMSARYEVKVDKAKVLKIFKELGSQNIEEIQEGYLYTKLFKSARETVSKFSLLDVYGTKTTEASSEITKDFAEKVAPLGFIIADVTLGTPEADPQTQAAIDERVKAAQTLEKLNLDKQIAQATAEKQKIEAEGIAAAEIEKARGQAEANKLMQQSITPELLTKMEMEARLKHGWVTIQGASVLTQQ